MNKRPLEKLTHNANYNQELFALARGIAQNCQQLATKTEGLPQDQKASLKDKQQQLENAIKNAINIFGKFVGISKAPLATVPDHGLNIFQAITDNIETSVQRYKEARKNNKIKEEKAKEAKDTKQAQRPQDIYPFIKPVAFDFHNHEKSMEFIRTELNLVKSRSLDEQFAYVDTVPKLQEMIEELSKQSQVAVDVEHSSKSYEGFTCLLQMSSRKKDYIIDVFPIWREMPLLKQIMENQTIIKVMHGAEMDTKWLQRDFNIHIINLFDTHRASRVLGFPKLSYAYLLNYYCNQTTDKTYQLADWRQRPLSNEMLHYARLDTHYLLQIFDRLLSDLHQKALTMNLNPNEVITDVYASSYEVTKTEAELFDYHQKQFYQKLKKETKDAQFVLFEKIFAILDKIARKEDMSFDEVVNYKLERQIVSKVKEMLYLRTRDNVKIKVDKFLCTFKESHLHTIFQDYLVEIKEQVESFFKNYQQQQEKDAKKAKKNRIVHLDQYQPAPIQEPVTNKPTFIKDFKQFSTKTYENPNINPFSMLVFEPIMNFLSRKAGLTQKQETVEEMEVQAMEEQSEVEQNVEAEVKEEGQKAEEGVIEFKRINPNVIYTIEEAEAVQEKHKPRKKRKEHEYEIKVKSKQANIFELLDD